MMIRRHLPTCLGLAAFALLLGVSVLRAQNVDWGDLSDEGQKPAPKAQPAPAPAVVPAPAAAVPAAKPLTLEDSLRRKPIAKAAPAAAPAAPARKVAKAPPVPAPKRVAAQQPAPQVSEPVTARVAETAPDPVVATAPAPALVVAEREASAADEAEPPAAVAAVAAERAAPVEAPKAKTQPPEQVAKLDFPKAAPAAPADAGDGKSWTLDSNNWQQGEGLLPPTVLKRVKEGQYFYKVSPVDPEKFKQNYSKPFWAASEANDGKYDVDPATCGLKDLKTGKAPEFYFGYPFPRIDAKNDPMAACKMAWNFTAANQMQNGAGATFSLNGIDGSGEFKRIKLWLHAQSFHGRSAGPIANPENLRDESMTQVLEPQDIDGVGGLTKRVNDWTSQDETWFYVPSTRRVRRVNAATRSDPVAGLDIFGDDLNCYAGKVEYYKWKLDGETDILAPVLRPYALPQKQISETRSEVEIPYFRASYETPGSKGAPWLVVENLTLVPRPVWIIEGQADDPYYNFGKVIMYMDKDMYRIYWKLVHNKAGEYFYNAMCAYHWSKSADGSFSAVTPNMVVGVNDKTNRAALGGRYKTQFLESKYEDSYFTLHHLTHMSD
jgi:hypothetical protein